MTVNTPIGVGWPAVPEEIAVLATGWPSANSVARCLSIETIMCSGPAGSGGGLSAARPAFASAFSDALERALFRARRSDAATVRELFHQLSGLPVAWAFSGPAIKSAANDTPVTSATRFIAQTPQPKAPTPCRQFTYR